MKKYTVAELNKILDLHRKWYNDEKGGQRADLRGAYLQGAYLQGAYLRGAYLQRAYLQGADLQGADLQGADLQGADLQRAYLRGAYLRGAYLQRADLRGAYLQRADLRGADLRGAYLQRAYLRGAYLRGAYLRGQCYQPDLYILKSVKGKIRAWKYLLNGKSPYQNSVYTVGKTYAEKTCDKNELNDCGKGLNVATLMWCYYDSADKSVEYLEVEFDAKDIVAIPLFSYGKFRVKKLKVLKKYTRKQVEKKLKLNYNKKK